MEHRPAITDPARISALAARIDRPIVLVGMMGVGKSSLGKRLAVLLGFDFVDADDEIEKAAQMTMPEIFAAHGEYHFRDGERRVIARLMGDARSRRVIATGGGAFCNDQTRELILDRGITVWLDSDVERLVERTARKNNRPLLQGGDPREILARLRNEREAHYSQAPIRVHSSNGPHTEALRRILEGIESWL
ncbi:MAG: shikimate kinase [Alphaproteobacteria bacterium]|nr:shikimate kinase [Alphaproteobacteria bacterium]